MKVCIVTVIEMQRNDNEKEPFSYMRVCKAFSNKDEALSFMNAEFQDNLNVGRDRDVMKFNVEKGYNYIEFTYNWRIDGGPFWRNTMLTYQITEQDVKEVGVA